MVKTLEQINREFLLEQSVSSAVSIPKKRGILFCGILILILIAVLSYSAGTKSKGGLFGFSVYKILSESMQSEIPNGSLILIKYIDPATIRTGDDITYTKDRNTKVTHRVTKIIGNYNGTGRVGFETKGIENSEPDNQIVDADSVLGKVVWHIAFVNKNERRRNEK